MREEGEDEELEEFNNQQSRPDAAEDTQLRTQLFERFCASVST
jgi:hypothetical protein